MGVGDIAFHVGDMGVFDSLELPASCLEGGSNDSIEDDLASALPTSRLSTRSTDDRSSLSSRVFLSQAFPDTRDCARGLRASPTLEDRCWPTSVKVTCDLSVLSVAQDGVLRSSTEPFLSVNCAVKVWF
eukprot:CAMPEP_0194520530 /NCGR_PEP_ID=MMETSP0253-20130528/54541_1 /TAXON_ID=2966 /ORGANISM="Noctiluca scintillans" /LENGTH=128 /DNA_ID=CAMNT_0039364781 /DNA_START=1137 /DNA_END=1523 /DNA_ORIENTATION=+